MSGFQPPPTYAEVVVFDPQGQNPKFNPIWLKWFLDVAEVLGSAGGGGGSIDHNSTTSLQGGTANQYYHLANALYTQLVAGSIGTATGTSLVTTGLNYSSATPVTETAATHTVATTTKHLICNRAGTVTVTLPSASTYAGRELVIKTIQAQTVVSAASNVIPQIGGAAATAILAATAGKFARIVANGTNWEIFEAN